MKRPKRYSPRISSGDRTARAFDGPTIDERAKAAWRPGALEPITLHEARHTFASLAIAAGVNAKALATYVGHASATVTPTPTATSCPGNEDEAAALLDAYLARATPREGARERRATA